MIILQFIQISLIANHKDSFTDSPNEIVKKIWIFSNVQFNRFAMGEELCQSLGCVGYRLFIFILKFLCCMGRYQLVDLIITELEYHMIYYNSMPLIS